MIFYKDESSGNYEQLAVQHDVVTTTLIDLKMFTPYQIVVSPYSPDGNGVPSQPVKNTTFEDGEWTGSEKSLLLLAIFVAININAWNSFFLMVFHI